MTILLGIAIGARVVGAQGVAPAKPEIEYDRFRDSTTVNASGHFALLSSEGKVRRDSLTVVVGLVYKGKPASGRPYRPYISLALIRKTTSGAGMIDSTEALLFIVDGAARFTAKPRMYAAQDFSSVGMFSEIVAYRLSVADFQRLARGAKAELRIGYGDTVVGAEALPSMAREVLRLNR